MSNKIGKCIKCGSERKLTRGYCTSKCYYPLLRSGNLKIIKHPEVPDILTINQQELLIGSLLGDGNLYTPDINKYNPIFSIQRTINDREYLQYQFNFFKDFCLTSPKNYETHDIRTYKIYKSCRFASRRCPVFSNFYLDWYPNGTKIVPKNLKLTPFIAAIWFCDDGSIIANKTNRLKIKLSTHGFSTEDTIWLCEYLTSLLKENFSVSIDNGHAFITGADAATKSFIKYIESNIPSCMSRKITWSDAHFLKTRARPHIKNRIISDLNDKELQILQILFTSNSYLSSIEICKKMSWLNNHGKLPSGYTRYLNRFKREAWIEPIQLVINGKSNTKYKITVIGKFILNEASKLIQAD